MVDLADEEGAGSGLHLRMAFHAEVGIMLHEELGVNGAVRIMTYSAAFAHGSVLKDEFAGLILMALRAGFIHTGETKTAGGFGHIMPVGIMALDATQAAFRYRMMVR